MWQNPLCGGRRKRLLSHCRVGGVRDLLPPGISVQFALRFINTELFSQARRGELKRGKLWGSPSQG